MASFIAPIIQGLQVLKEHKAQLAAQQEQNQQNDLKKAILAAVLRAAGGNQNG